MQTTILLRDGLHKLPCTHCLAFFCFCFWFCEFVASDLCVTWLFHNLPFSCVPTTMLQQESYLGYPFVVLIAMPLIVHKWCVTNLLKFVEYLVYVKNLQ